MTPKVDSSSNALLNQRYDDLYNYSADFKSKLHNVVTSSRALLLILDPGAGGAEYDTTNNSIKVWRQSSTGVNKTDEELRDDIFFEMHNAKKVTDFQALQGSRGYNRESLTNGSSRKKAGFALAAEWTEWINAAQYTILANIVNAQSTGGQLLKNPPEYQGDFSGTASWLKFSNYLNTQSTENHTADYDPAAGPGTTWIGHDILRIVATGSGAALEITADEFAPTTGSPRLKSRGNPFTWDLVNALQLH
jgi:hypothetical protein